MRLLILITLIFIAAPTHAQFLDTTLPPANQELVDKCVNYYAKLRKRDDKDWRTMKEVGPGEDSYFILNIKPGPVSDAKALDELKQPDAPEGGFKKWCQDLKILMDQNTEPSEELKMCKSDRIIFCL